jgi:excisionase family DNA binding protein
MTDAPHLGDERLMDVGAVAQALGVQPRAVYDAIDRGELAARNHGEGIRIRRSDVEGFRSR